MTRLPRLLITLPAAIGLVVAAGAALAAPRVGGLNLFNQTGQTMTALFIRRTGTQQWRPLPARPAKAARASIPFDDMDCAFDLKAVLEDGKDSVWSGVNLCEVKLLTLNRNEAGVTWVDYD